MKTLLITGANGFVGQNLLNLITESFSSKYRVVLLSSVVNDSFTTILHKNYMFEKKCFLKKKINRIDIVLHIGAFIPKSNLEMNDIEASNSNIINTKHLITNLPNTPKKFIFISTTDVYKNSKNHINENSLILPYTMYGWSKLYCEKMLEKWSEQKNVCLQIIRLGHVYGNGEQMYRKVIPITINNIILDKNPQVFGKGNDLRSYLNIKDGCRMIIKALSLEKYQKPINVCSAHSYRISYIVKKLIQISGKSLDIDYLKDKNYFSNDYVFDTSKMHELLGSEIITLDRGLKEEYELF